MFEIQRPKPIVREAFWISKKTDKYHYNYFCSNCQNKSRFRKTPFCPMCGFRMIEEELA